MLQDHDNLTLHFTNQDSMVATITCKLESRLVYFDVAISVYEITSSWVKRII
jgi:hypothetical protein